MMPIPILPDTVAVDADVCIELSGKTMACVLTLPFTSNFSVGLHVFIPKLPR